MKDVLAMLGLTIAWFVLMTADLVLLTLIVYAIGHWALGLW